MFKRAYEDNVTSDFKENSISIVLNKDNKFFAHGILLDVLNEETWKREFIALQKKIEELKGDKK